MSVRVIQAGSADLTELAAVAATTFPLACPPSAPPEQIAAFIAANLTEEHFAGYLGDPDRTVLVARADQILGYAMLIQGVPDDADVQRAVPLRPAIELSKMYVLPEAHGTGAGDALMTTAIDHATACGALSLWLGVNQENQRAQRFYAKHGYTVAGTKTFRLGNRLEHDFVLVRPLA
ncbi:ribosomal protein S18 acetylase RimI-like enzyme [Mycobacterium sp. MAA66]|uniref:GNAT family N-acetyltransferase n=1 Tax=Mycobacterium sp. MAA66 TaxID=3156297 RepID=UPI0035157F15